MSMKDALIKVGYKLADARQQKENPQAHRKSAGGKQIAGQAGPRFPKIIFRDNGCLRRELLTSEAEEWADLLYDNGNGVTATQLRHFYNAVKALQSRIEAGGFPANEAVVGLLKSKAAYAYARAEKKRQKGFGYLKNMIQEGVDASISEEAFNDFALFFEAVMGFFKGGKS